jgi:small subunit ribosomal protein S20
MNKKQRNRKIIEQNKRNRLINRRYNSAIKTLLKVFLVKTKSLANIAVGEEKETVKLTLKKISQDLYSIIDKGTKKNSIHKNTAARKKSRIAKLLTNLN